MAGDVSVTYDTGGGDNGKPGKAGTQLKMPAAVGVQSFGYGESCQTVPLPYFPQSTVVP